MKLGGDAVEPIYMRIAVIIEDQILNGTIEENEQVFSKNQIAKLYHVNPATAAKGINILVEEGILYKKRGIGMFVSEGAGDYIKEKRKKTFFKKYILNTIIEAGKLNISIDEIIGLIKDYKECEGKL